MTIKIQGMFDTIINLTPSKFHVVRIQTFFRLPILEVRAFLRHNNTNIIINYS